MTITSNITGVIRQVERLRTNVPLAAERALALPTWEAEAIATARATLLALADPKQRQFIEPFVKTVVSSFASPVRVFTMHSPMPTTGDPIAEAQAAKAALSAQDLSQNLFLRPVSEFEQLVLDWVGEAKDKDRRDVGKTDEEIAQFISYVLLSPNDYTVSSGPNRGRLVRDVLTPHIAAYVAARQSPLDAATVDAWLRAVLAAWRVVVVKRFPALMRAELRAMKGEL